MSPTCHAICKRASRVESRRSCIFTCETQCIVASKLMHTPTRVGSFDGQQSTSMSRSQPITPNSLRHRWYTSLSDAPYPPGARPKCVTRVQSTPVSTNTRSFKKTSTHDRYTKLRCADAFCLITAHVFPRSRVADSNRNSLRVLPRHCQALHDC